MTGVLLQADPAVLGAALVVWAWLGMRSGSLAIARTPRELYRRTGWLLAGIGTGTAMIIARAGLVVALAQSGWWFVQEKVVLSLPIVAGPALAVLVVSVPRLVRVRRSARALNGIDAMAPSLRQQAAHPLLAWPIQLTAFGAAAAEIVFFVVAYPATAGSSFAVLTGVALAGVVAWHRLVRRHRRLGDAVVVPSRQARLLRGTGVLTGLVAAGIALPIAALVVATPAPPAHADAAHGVLDLGGGAASTHGHGATTSVTALRGPVASGPVREFVLTARHATVTLPSGSTVEALTFDGTLPGPRIEVTEGDLVQVVLRNLDITEGVTIHWHGYDVPNGEDGVPGVTQDRVGVGEEFTYRFRADQVGTFWYHSHQDSYRQVTRGLYGTLVVHPKAGPVPPVEDVTVAYHRLDGGPATLMGSDVDTWRDVAPGTPVRLRIVNSANSANVFSLHGVAARLVALDGGDLAGPEPVVNPAIDLTAGGRADLVFVMPAQPVRLDAGGPGLLLAPPGGRAQLVRGPTTLIDPFRYGSAAPTPFGPDSRFDRDFTLVLDQKLARHNGIPTFAYTVNGNAYPEIPTQLVRAGELVRFTIVARGFEAHPIHPHGHHVLVLSRNGVMPRTPLWLDTFEVRPGDVWQVAMRADNPGVWMDHCHDLRHAAEGMVFHLAYEGVSSPFALSPAG